MLAIFLILPPCPAPLPPLVDDMFWSDPFDLAASVAACRQRWGVTPRPLWATTQWGGRRITAGSNIVFSNGLLDPWHGGG